MSDHRFGLHATAGRCFPFWQDYVMCVRREPEVETCKPLGADYFECLHGIKLRERQRLLAEQEERNKSGKPAHPEGGGHH